MSASAAQSAIDYLGAAEVAIIAFFVVLAIVLLARYRQASESVSAASELNHDLWRALEDRLKKQDERILDLMGKVELIEARVTSERPQTQLAALHDATASQPPPTPRPAPEPKIPAPFAIDLDATEKTALKFLEGGAVPTTDITKKLGRSREHTARLMKALYDRGLVERDESAKPFVYRLTEAGKRLLE